MTIISLRDATLNVLQVDYAYGADDQSEDGGSLVEWINTSLVIEGGGAFDVGGWWIEGDIERHDGLVRYSLQDADGARDLSRLTKALGGEVGEGVYSSDEQAVYAQVFAALDEDAARGAARRVMSSAG